jgi:hypothetical protein
MSKKSCVTASVNLRIQRFSDGWVCGLKLDRISSTTLSEVLLASPAPVHRLCELLYQLAHVKSLQLHGVPNFNNDLFSVSLYITET